MKVEVIDYIDEAISAKDEGKAKRGKLCRMISK